MPQLDPLPWFAYFVLTWAILPSLAPNKILTHLNPWALKSKTITTYDNTWTWPWQ